MKTRFDADELLHAIDARDADRFLLFLTEDARFRFGANPDVTGAAAIREFLSRFFGGLASIQHRKIGYWEVDGGQGAFLEGEVTYGYPNGKRVTIPFLNHFRLRDGQIRAYDIFIDPTPAATASR